MKKILILIILFSHSNWAYSQRFRSFGTLVKSKNYENVHFEIYEPNIKIKAIYKDISETKNQTIIETLRSIISCNSAEWDKYNNEDGKSERTDLYFKEKLKNEKYSFYEPIMALYYYDTEKKVEACLMKFAFGNDSLNIKLAISPYFEKKDNRWVQAGNEIMGFPFMVASLSPQILVPLLTGEPTIDDFINEMISLTRNRYGGLDKVKLDNVLNKWKHDSFEYKTYGEPFSMVNYKPENIIERTPMKGDAKIITEVKFGTSGTKYSFLYDTPISIEKIESKRTKNLLLAYFNAKNIADLQKISDNPIDKFPTHFNKLQPEQIKLVHEIYAENPSRENIRIRMFHFKKTSTNEDIFLKTMNTTFPEKVEIDKISNDSTFNDLEWLFKNLSPETFHELITYPTKKEGYSHPELIPDLDLLIDRKNDAFSTEGLTDYFKKLKGEGKCKGCFTP